MKDKIFEFFKSKGYIFIALICLAAVIAAGVSIINLSNEEADEPVAAYRTPSGDRSDVSTPTKNPNGSNPQSTIASKPIDDNENNNNENNEEPGTISIVKPVDGDVYKRQSITRSYSSGRIFSRHPRDLQRLTISV